MADYVKEIKTYKNLTAKLNMLMQTIQARNPELYTNYEAAFATLRTLQNRLAELYTVRMDGSYRRMEANDIQQLQNSFTQAIGAVSMLSEAIKSDNDLQGNKTVNKTIREINTMLTDDKKIVDKLDYRDYLPFPKAAYKIDRELKKNDYVNGKFKAPGFYEYSRLFLTSKLTEDQVLERFIKKSPAEVYEEYNNGIRNNPHLYEYVNLIGKVPANIRHTGDPQKINDYIGTHGGELTLSDKIALKSHADATLKVLNIKNDASTKMAQDQPIGENRPKVTVHSDDWVEIDLHQPHFQTSANGCWSCAGQSLVESRGIKNVTQEDIRAYRPVLGPKDQLIEDNAQLVTGDDLSKDDDKSVFNELYGRDGGKNLMDMADSILAFAPNTM